ncbi:MAG: hypothetical protein JXR19_09635 [Bacteroidia bacterium]
MKDKNAIDKIFKENLDHKGMPYSQENWDQMAALLSKNKAAGASWYKWGALALLIIGISTVLYFSPWLRNSNPISSQIEKTTEVETSLSSNNALAETESSKANSIDIEHPKENHQVFSETERSATELRRQTIQAAKSDNSDRDMEIAPPIQNEEIQVLDDYDYLLLAMNSIDQLTFNSPSQQTIGLAKKAINSKRKAVNFFVSPYLGLYNFSKSHNTVSPLKAYENPKNGRDFGIQLRLSRNSWSLVTGLASTQLSENTNYQEKVRTYSYDTTLVLAQRKFIQRPDGSYIARLEERIDTSIVERDTVFCPNCEARFSYISIPLNVYYELRRSRVSLFTQAGLTFNFLRSTSGIYANNESSSVIDPLAAPAASKQTLSMNALLGVKYHLNSKLNVQMSYGQNWNINSMMLNYEQKAQLQQLRIGVEWRMF